jgi:hypothetical protein
LTDLAGDPIFQLNTVLWMLQHSPNRPGTFNAVLRHAGYGVRALGPKMTAPAAVEEALAKVNLSAGVPDPDVLADAPDDAPMPVFECKRSAFTPDSTTATQSRKLLARASDLSLVVGAPKGKTVPGAFVLVTRETEAPTLVNTIEVLRAEHGTNDIPAAPGSVLSIRNDPGVGVQVTLAGGDLPGPAGQVLATTQTIIEAAGDEEIARPLYLVPFDPGVEQEQDEADLCRRILLERARMFIAAQVGRCAPPQTLVINGLDILRYATDGLSDYWRKVSDRNAAAQVALQFAKQTLRGVKNTPPQVAERPGNPPQIEVTIKTVEQRDQAANYLVSAPLPGDLADLNDNQPELDLTTGGDPEP